jgi:hypothetical protein
MPRSITTMDKIEWSGRIVAVQNRIGLRGPSINEATATWGMCFMLTGLATLACFRNQWN